LKKGDSTTLKPDQPVVSGGSISIFARGADKKTEISCGTFGTLSTDKPFIGDVLDSKKAAELNAGLKIDSNAEVSLVAFYTPPG